MHTLSSHRYLALGLLLLVLIIVGGYLVLRPRRIPDTVEHFGSFDVVTHTIPYLTGWNEGRIHTATTENYSVRYRGKPFVFEGKAGLSGNETTRYDTFNSIITFSPGTPVVLLNVGDPNNRSFFYLAREVNGQADAQFVGEATGTVSVDWIDPPADGVVRVRDVARHRGRLAGGRWLLVGEQSVLDLQSFTAYPLAQGRTAEDPSVNQFKPPIAMSPDQRSFVRLGYAAPPDGSALLIVFGITSGSWHNVPIRRRIERFNEWAEIDATWFDHYYEWQREAGASDRLVPRPGVKPLPYRGYRPPQPNDPTYREYELMRVSSGMRGAFLEYLERVEGATRLPDDLGGSASLIIGGDTIHVTTHDDQVGLWMSRGDHSELVFRIGDRFDAVLATGVHDELFLP
jgi:hypothetical protein